MGVSSDEATDLFLTASFRPKLQNPLYHLQGRRYNTITSL